MNLTHLSAAFMAFLLASGVAMAQSSTAGGGTGFGGAGANGQGPVLDVPVAPPVQTQPVAEAPPEEEEEEEEPRDGRLPTLYGEPVISENSTIYIIVDYSGSMGARVTGGFTGADGGTTGGSRLDRAKAECQKLVAALTSNFQFGLMGYDCGRTVFPGSGGMVSADSANKGAAFSFISSWRATGATGTGPAGAAAANANKECKLFCLISDGAPNCGASGFAGHKSMILGANGGNAVWNTFGISANGSFEQFLRDIANATGGSYFDK